MEEGQSTKKTTKPKKPPSIGIQIPAKGTGAPPRKIGTLASPLSSNIGLPNTNPVSSVNPLSQTVTPQIPGIGVSLSQPPQGKVGVVRSNPDKTLGGVPKKEFMPMIPLMPHKKSIKKEKESTEQPSKKVETSKTMDTQDRIEKKNFLKSPLKKANQSVRKGKINEKPGGSTTDSPFSMGPPSSSSSIPESETLPRPSTVKKVKQHKYLEIDETNPYHPIVISNSTADSNPDNQFDPFGLGRNAFEEVFLRESELCLVQLPSQLPVKQNKVMSISEKDQKDDVNSTETVIPDGYLGKLIIYKSGRIKLKIGDFLYDVKRGTEGNFLQQVVAISETTKQCFSLGELSRRFTCVPNLEHLFS